MNINLSDELQKTYRLWPTPIGLLAAIIFQSILVAGVFSQIDGVNKTTIFNIPSFIFICFVIIFLTYSYWIYSNRPQKNKNNTFGFIVSIHCDNDETDKKFRADFVNNLKKQIKDGDTEKYFNFIEIKNHNAKKITSVKDAELILKKTKSHFIIYGEVRTRETTHYIDLQSIVTHKPIHLDISNSLSKEMTELLPNKIKIEDNNFLESFEVTSKWTEISSKYLIGNANLLSGYIDQAFDLYNEVFKTCQNHKNIPFNDQLYQRSKDNIIIVLDIKISSLYQEWVVSHNIFLFKKIHDLTIEYDKYKTPNYSIETIKAIVSILLFHDTEKAIKILSNFPKNQQNATWLLNNAFLFAYKGDLTASYKLYRQALTRPDNEFDDGLINKVEDFILLMISQNDQNHQLHYCLGIINKDFKEDLLLAQQDFNTFLSIVPIDSFSKEKEITKKWINDMRMVA